MGFNEFEKKQEFRMSVENKIRMLAGSLIIISLLLNYFVSPYWLILTAFVGLNLFQSSMTKFCPAEIILRKMEKNQKTA
jgi:hypothetical protein